MASGEGPNAPDYLLLLGFVAFLALPLSMSLYISRMSWICAFASGLISTWVPEVLLSSQPDWSESMRAAGARTPAMDRPMRRTPMMGSPKVEGTRARPDRPGPVRWKAAEM